MRVVGSSYSERRTRLETGDDPDGVAASIAERGSHELHPKWGELPWRALRRPVRQRVLRASSAAVSEDGRVVNVHALLATGVNADGHRETLGLQVTSGEDGAGYVSFGKPGA